MRTLVALVVLALPFALAAPAHAQGLDKDVLEDIIDKATKDQKKAKAKPKPKAKGAEPEKKEAKPKTDKSHAKAMRKVLRKKKADVNFVKAPFAEGVAFVKKESGLAAVVTKKASEALAKTTFTLRGKALTLRAFLDLFVAQASKDLRCGVKDGALWFGLAKEWKAAKVTKL